MDQLCSRWNAFSGDCEAVTLRLAALYAQLHAFASIVLSQHCGMTSSASTTDPSFPPLPLLAPISSEGLQSVMDPLVAYLLHLVDLHLNLATSVDHRHNLARAGLIDKELTVLRRTSLALDELIHTDPMLACIDNEMAIPLFILLCPIPHPDQLTFSVRRPDAPRGMVINLVRCCDHAPFNCCTFGVCNSLWAHIVRSIDPRFHLNDSSSSASPPPSYAAATLMPPPPPQPPRQPPSPNALSRVTASPVKRPRSVQLPSGPTEVTLGDWLTGANDHLRPALSNKARHAHPERLVSNRAAATAAFQQRKAKTADEIYTVPSFAQPPSVPVVCFQLPAEAFDTAPRCHCLRIVDPPPGDSSLGASWHTASAWFTIPEPATGFSGTLFFACCDFDYTAEGKEGTCSFSLSVPTPVSFLELSTNPMPRGISSGPTDTRLSFEADSPSSLSTLERSWAGAHNAHLARCLTRHADPNDHANFMLLRLLQVDAQCYWSNDSVAKFPLAPSVVLSEGRFPLDVPAGWALLRVVTSSLHLEAVGISTPHRTTRLSAPPQERRVPSAA